MDRIEYMLLSRIGTSERDKRVHGTWLMLRTQARSEPSVGACWNGDRSGSSTCAMLAANHCVDGLMNKAFPMACIGGLIPALRGFNVA